MTFINVSLLAGAALAVVPLVLHLLLRQRPRRFEFPALQFLRRRQDANQRQLRLRHLLLLALRMLLIALLAVALARPRVKISGGVLGSQKDPVAAALLFDSSKRMEYRHENRTRLEVAQDLGRRLLARLPPESQVAVLDSRPGPAAFQVDLGAARYRIEHLETTTVAQPLASVLVEALRLVTQSELPRREVFVFTDLARRAWPASEYDRLKQRIAAAEGTGLYLIDVGVAQPVNVGLGDVVLPSTVLPQGSPLDIGIEVLAYGGTAERLVELYLLETDPQTGMRRPVKKGAQAVALEPGQSRRVEFRVSQLAVGTHQGYLEIVGQDGLPADDRRYFSVQVRPAWPVLVAATPPANPAYLSETLAPTPLRRQGEARYEVTVVGTDELGRQNLERFAAVFLVDPGPVPAEVWQKLRDYVSSGRGLALFLGRNADAAVDAFNQAAAQEVLPAVLKRQVRDKEGSIHLAPRDYEHPMLVALRDTAGGIPWDAFPVFRYWQLGDLAAGARVVVPYSDGAPAVVERPLGKGRVVVVTTSISDNPNQDPWSLLLSGENAWPFFVLANEMAATLVGGTAPALNYFAGQTALLELNPDWPFRSYLLTQPDGLEARVAPDLKQFLLTVAATEQLGNYRVQAGGSEGGVDLGFSVNLPAAETRLDRVAEDELARLLEPLPVRIARDEHQIELDLSTGRVGRELFPALILIVAVVLGLEHLVANRFYRRA